MDHVDEHKQAEEDQTQGKGKAKVFPLEKGDPQLGGYNHNRPWRESSGASTQMVNLLFKVLVYQILEKVKNEPYFKWPNKMGETCLSVIRVSIVTTIRIGDI